METLEQKIARVTAEKVELAEYDPRWPLLYEQERERLYELLPQGVILRVEHIGSTSVPGLAAKPVVDMLVEIADAEWGRTCIPHALEPLGYDCFWRPTAGNDIPPWYTWCIRRNHAGRRTHHLHFVEPGQKDAELAFRDMLRRDAELALAYASLKRRLLEATNGDRVAYTREKGAFIRSVLSAGGLARQG